MTQLTTYSPNQPSPSTSPNLKYTSGSHGAATKAAFGHLIASIKDITNAINEHAQRAAELEESEGEFVRTYAQVLDPGP
jgi:hypothetical protein